MKPKRNLVKLRKIVVKKALNGENITHLARAFMVSRKFIYKWMKRHSEDPEGEWYKERSSRPKTIKGKVTEEKKERILALRRAYGFNIVKIAYILTLEGINLSHTTVWKTLQQEGEEKWRTTKKAYKRVKRFEREEPNDLWQIDIKGPFWVEEQGQHLHLVSVIDDHSRFCVGAKFFPRPVKTWDILHLLDQAMQTYGTPRQILTDNGAIFHPQRGGTSSFTRWCKTNIIDHIRARVYHPETCGKVERLHGTIIREMKRLELTYCNADLRRYRDYYNFSRPHQGINLQTPGERFMNVPLTLSIPSSVTHVC